MSKTFSTTGLSAYLEENIQQIEKVRKEIDEIQVGFQSAFVAWKGKHDAELLRLTVVVAERLEETGTELQAMVAAQTPVELQAIVDRRKDLETLIIPKYQQELDQVLHTGQARIEDLRRSNPELNEREEKLKASLGQNQVQLESLNAQIQQGSRGLGGLLRFSRLGELDRQRQRLLGRMEEQQSELGKVRGQWEETLQKTMAEETELQLHWQQVATDLAQRQAEFNYLSVPANRELLARQRAIHHVLDDLNEPIACPVADLQAELDLMIQYNRQTDDYQAGLGAVGGLIGMLGSIQEGMRRFNTSVEALSEQERANSQYLKPLQIAVSDTALNFNLQWGDLYKKVLDEKSICAHPAEFTQAMQAVIDNQLSVARLKGMFDSLGNSLKQATEKWKS